jgi:hypothetical protein
MAIRVEVYTAGGMAGGTMSRTGTLRDALSSDESLTLEATTWQGLEDPAPRSVGTVAIPVDDILFAVADDETLIPMHVAWHHVLLDSGPYRIEGDLATMPGFDPGRSLARPTGDFVLLRDVRLSLHGHPEAGASVGDHALVNRYAVETVQADLMLGFFFPGAAVGMKPSPGIALPAASVGGAA